MPETLVLDASALVEALIGTPQGVAVRQRLQGCDLHAPAHIDAEALSALGRLHRSAELDTKTVSAALSEIALAPIVRHPLAGLLAGAWAERNQLRLVDALYVELATRLRATLLTTDGRLARARPDIELIT
ncbi:MAG: type II toxin-antitoxin system VapC family toxin [Actinomycetota bacterium]|nr:type II toxin-antitoxin system VapC family toxin [Actinomycetota bacterium]